MSLIRSKGTLLKLTIASTLTTVAQMVAHTPPPFKSTGYESKTLDQSGAGVGRELDGYANSAEFDAEFWWDPELASHAAMLALITTPAKGVWQTLFVNSGASTIDYTSADFELSPAVDMGKGLMAKIKGNVDGLAVLTV